MEDANQLAALIAQRLEKYKSAPPHKKDFYLTKYKDAVTRWVKMVQERVEVLNYYDA